MSRRRLQSKGHLFKQNGWWRLRWREDVIAPDGTIKRSRPNVMLARCEGPDALNERQARRKAYDEHLSKVNRLELLPQSMMKVKDFVERRFVPEYVPALKVGGVVHYESWLRHVNASLGHLPLRDVKHEHVQRACLALLETTYPIGKDREIEIRDPKTGAVTVESQPARRAKYSVQSALHLKHAISAVFEHAKAVGIFAGENPAHYVRLPEIRRKERHALTVHEMKLLLANLPAPAREMAMLAVLTGMNIAEICGLKWKWINASNDWAIVEGEAVPPRAIAVRLQWSNRKGGGAYHSVKAKSRMRILPMDTQVTQLLDGLAPETDRPEDPVFVSKTGRPIDAHNIFNRQLKPTGTALGMSWIGWHVFRHTFITWMRRRAASPADQMASLGHTDIRTTMMYGEQDLDRRRVVVGTLGDELLAVAKKPAQAETTSLSVTGKVTSILAPRRTRGARNGG